MKTFNKETFQSWALVAFDWDLFKKECDISPDAPLFWSKDYEDPELESLYIGEEAVIFDVREEGYQLDYWPCDKEGHEIASPLDPTKYIEPSKDFPLLLAKYVPENYQEIQECSERFAEQKAKISLKDYIESD